MIKRRRFKQTESLAERLASFANLMRERAETMVSIDDRVAAMAKANQADIAAQMDRWIRSAELKRPE